MSEAQSSIAIAIPAWIDDVVASFSGGFEDDIARMRLAVRLSRENVERGGGPFGAAIFANNVVVAAGVNRVLDCGLTIAHAEIIAIMRAQARLASQPLAASPLTLVTSCEPCCQCFGALVWSGVTQLVCGAATADAEAVGFDEGPKPEAWPQTLERRGIRVQLAVCRDEARDVLNEYVRRGGRIYGLGSARAAKP